MTKDQIRIAELEEEVLQLRAAVRGVDISIPPPWGLTAQEGALLLSLLGAPTGYRTYEQLCVALSNAPGRKFMGEQVGKSHVSVVACHLRKKLPDINTTTVKSRGIQLEAKSWQIMTDKLEAYRAKFSRLRNEFKATELRN